MIRAEVIRKRLNNWMSILPSWSGYDDTVLKNLLAIRNTTVVRSVFSNWL